MRLAASGSDFFLQLAGGNAYSYRRTKAEENFREEHFRADCPDISLPIAMSLHGDWLFFSNG